MKLKPKNKNNPSKKIEGFIEESKHRRIQNHFDLSDKLYQEIGKGLYEKKNKTDVLKASIFLYNITIVRDELEMFEPVYTVKYKDLIFNEYRVIENATFSELTSKLYDERLFIDDIAQVRRLISEIINGSHNKKIKDVKFITTETKVFKEGFFIKNDKVIENTLITGIEPTKDEIKESIQLINELLDGRGSAIDNDCTVLRFMLWSPFCWCLKEIGKTKGLYGLILTGKPQTNKTGSCLNFSWFYSKPDNREQPVSTTSVFGSRLEESTLPAIIDECYTLISREDMQDPMKRCIYNKETRATKDRNNPQLTVSYKALSLPIFTLNEYQEIKNFINRRYHISYYPLTMVVSDEDAENFENKYSPESNDSPLKSLRYLGRAFADKFIPYVESKSKELYQLENLTIKILREISEEVGEEFNESVYNIQDSVDDFDQDTCAIIRTGLNKLFRNNHNKNPSLNYSETDFINCANNGEINWLYYRNKDKDFVINKKGFEKQVSQLVEENMDYESILKELNIDVSNVKYNKDKPIHTTRGNTRGFELSREDVIIKVFDMSFDSLRKSD